MRTVNIVYGMRLAKTASLALLSIEKFKVIDKRKATVEAKKSLGPVIENFPSKLTKMDTLGLAPSVPESREWYTLTRNVPLNYATRTCTLPFVCPVIRNRRGLEPILLEASHSCTQYEVMPLPSTERIVQILKKRNKLPAQYKYNKQMSKITADT